MAKLSVRFFELLTKGEQQFADLDIERLLDLVSNLPDKEAYVQLARMELLGSIYSPQGAPPAPQTPMIVLDRITREIRMRIERGRQYRALELEDGDTVAEPTHIGLFPGNVVGIMRQSGQSPTPSSFRDFLNQIDAFSGEDVVIRPLVDYNALRALRDVDKMTQINLELDAATARAVGGTTRYLADALTTLSQSLPGVSVELALKFSPRGPEETSDRALETVRDLVKADAFTNAQRANMKYRRIDDHKAASFDFIAEAVAQEVEVEVDDLRGGPNNARASEGIMKAYLDQFEDIQSALNRTGTVGPPA